MYSKMISVIISDLYKCANLIARVSNVPKTEGRDCIAHTVACDTIDGPGNSVQSESALLRIKGRAVL